MPSATIAASKIGMSDGIEIGKVSFFTLLSKANSSKFNTARRSGFVSNPIQNPTRNRYSFLAVITAGFRLPALRTLARLS